MPANYTVQPGGKVRIGAASGSVKVIAEDRQDVQVDRTDLHVEHEEEGRILNIKSKSRSFEVRVPTGTNVSVGAMSGSVTLEGEFGNVKVSAMSGSVSVDRARGNVDIRSVSGSLQVKRCEGDCHLTTKSGGVYAGMVGGGVRAATMSGRVDVGTQGRDDVEVKAISGSLSVRIAGGKTPRVRMRSLSGRIVSDVPQGNDFEIKGSTLSGNMEITAEPAG
jgi:DUF4097 and DUF4098 domain-containing protein YvlB